MFQKILALKVVMHMCTRVKDRVNFMLIYVNNKIFFKINLCLMLIYVNNQTLKAGKNLDVRFRYTPNYIPKPRTNILEYSETFKNILEHSRTSWNII